MRPLLIACLLCTSISVFAKTDKTVPIFLVSACQGREVGEMVVSSVRDAIAESPRFIAVSDLSKAYYVLSVSCEDNPSHTLAALAIAHGGILDIPCEKPGSKPTIVFEPPDVWLVGREKALNIGKEILVSFDTWVNSKN